MQEAYNFIQAEKRKMFKEGNDKLSKAIMESKRNLFTKREEILDKVFENVGSKINDYLLTDDYKNLLFRLVESSIASAGEGELIILINKSDFRFEDELKNKFGNSNLTFEISQDNFIGGCIARNESLGIVVDETILDKINEQKQLFIELSGLTIE